MMGFTLAPIGMLRTPMTRNPATKTGFGWNISERRPEISMKAAKVSVYPETTHCRDESEKPRSLPI